MASFDEVGIFDEFEIVVAYTAALLQQHFDVGALRRAAESDLDRRAAVEALVIRDANTVGQEYMAAHISPDRFASAPLPVRGRTIENSPEFVRRRALFAPQGGTNFIAALRSTGQWDSMRLVYKNPPASTEQIIHPDRYLEGDEPVAVTLPDLASVLGSKWAEIYSGVLGESFLKAYLSQWSEGDSDEAATGWGGDQFSLLEGPSGERVLVGLLVWDTVGDANQFLDLVSGITHPSGRARLSANQERVLVILGDENAADVIATRFTDF